MSRWATCSRPTALAVGLLLTGGTAEVRAQLSLKEALAGAFPPPATVERRTAFLTTQDLAAVQVSAGPDAPVTQRVVTYYLARRDGKPVGVAYFDSHRVRTLNEIVMIVIEPPDRGKAGKDRIRSVEVLRFAEPPEYHASDPWLDQFKGKSLDQELSLKRSIANMTGATLTSNAIVRATRRVLAIHERIRPFAPAAERAR
jgi:Na+-translocating ferredoxin:NAD+ oxidoreductase RnfG subunit